MANEQTKVNIGLHSDSTQARDDIKQTVDTATKSAHQIAQETKKTGTNVKKELRELKNAMSSMLADGIDPISEGYQKLAKRAGELQDAMGDAAEEIKAQADDTRDLSRAIGAFSDGVNAVQAYQSALSLLGIESDGAAEAIQKMMAAQQLCNSINEIGTSITSKSTILGQTYIKIQNAMAEATKAQTVAQKAANMAMLAAPYLAIAAAIGVAVAAIHSHNKAMEEEQAAVEESKKRMEAINSKVNEVSGSYTTLATQYRALKSEHEKQQWIEENKSKFHELGLEVKTVGDAEYVFVSNSSAVIRALALRAAAAAQAALAQQKYADALKGKSVAAGEKIDSAFYASSNLQKLLNMGYVRGEHSGPLGMMRYVWTESGAAARNAYVQQQALNTLTKETTQTVNLERQAYENLNKATGGRVYNGSTPTASRVSPTHTTPSKTTGKTEAPAVAVPQFSSDLLGNIGKLPDVTPNLQKLNDTLDELKQKEIETMLTNKEFVDGMVDSLGGMSSQFADQWGSIIEMIDKGGSSLEVAAASMAVLGAQLQQIGGDGAIAKAGATLAAIGQIILGFANASRIAAETTGPWGWLAFMGAGLGAIATTISTIKGYNTGGIVSGTGNTDTVPAMLTPGEAVFTRRQQAQLFRMANGNGNPQGALSVIDINTRIHGGDIIASQRIYNNSFKRYS